MTMEQPAAAPRRPRWLFAALIASLAVNLLVAGFFGAKMWHHRKDPTWRSGEPGLLGFVRKLPEEKRPALRNRLKAARETIKPLRQGVDDAWSAANAALGADPFDKAAAKAAFDKAIAADSAVRAAIDDELIATAESLNAEERRLLQEWREKRRPKMHRRHGRKDKDNEKDKAGQPEVVAPTP